VKERLQKLMAQANLGSRRTAEDLIRQGRVRVNGEVAKLGDQADPQTDVVEVDGARLNLANDKKVYIAAYKPRNVLTTNAAHSSDDRRTLREMIPVQGHLYAIGRLDADSEGLVVMTNDGELTNKLTHPRYRHTKTYRVTVQGLPNEEALERWQTGVFLEDGKTAPCSVRVIRGGTTQTVLRIVMTEGRKRQIRRVATLLGHPVKRLLRTNIGMLDLGELRAGDWRELTPREVKLMSTPSPELKGIRARQTRQKESNDSMTPPPAAPAAEPAKPARGRRAARTTEATEAAETPTRERRTGRGPAKPDARPSSGKPGSRRPAGKPGTKPAGQTGGRRSDRPGAKPPRRNSRKDQGRSG
jgi:pseudouridine synthase